MTADQRTALINAFGYETRRDGLGNVFVRRFTDGVRSWVVVPDGTANEILEWFQAKT